MMLRIYKPGQTFDGRDLRAVRAFSPADKVLGFLSECSQEICFVFIIDRVQYAVSQTSFLCCSQGA